MSLVPFPRYLEHENLTFGASAELLDRISHRLDAAPAFSELLEEFAEGNALLPAVVLLRLRRAWVRYQSLLRWAEGAALEEEFWSRTQVAAVRFARRQTSAAGAEPALAQAFEAFVASTLKHGRLRVHAKDPSDPTASQLVGFAGRSEDPAKIPPHRWLAVGRGVSDGLLYVDVIPPEGEPARSLLGFQKSGLADELVRAGAKSVLDCLNDRAERESIETAADSLYGLLSRPACLGVVAGLALTESKLYGAILALDGEVGAREFGSRDLQGLMHWLREHLVSHVGVARLEEHVTSAELLQTLAAQGFTAEPMREAGLMKQARQRGGAIKASAAQVVAERLRDPLAGTSGLGVDELGLGEYLDRVDAERLRSALEDVRTLVTWERATGKSTPSVARGVSLSPWLKSLSDLLPGMEVPGVVANLTHFGVFVDVGLPIQGLVHLSELADCFIRHPSEVVKVGDRVRARVLGVDGPAGKLSLSLRSERPTNKRAGRGSQTAARDKLEALFQKKTER